MLFLSGLIFLLLFPLQILGIPWIAGTAVLIVASKASLREFPVLNAKDAFFLAYAVLAIIPVLAHGETPTFFVRLVVYPWLITIVFQNLRYDERRIKACFGVLTAVSLGIATFMLFQYAPGQFDFSLRHLFSLNRNIGLYYISETRIGANAAASMSAAAIILSLAHLKFSVKPRLAAYPALGLATVFLVVAGARNAAGAIIICTGLFFFYGKTAWLRHRPRSMLRIVVTSGVLVVGAAGAYDAIRAGAHGDRLTSRVEGLLSLSDDRTVQVRMVYWASAIEMVREEPLGWGFNEYYSRYTRTPHNEMLGQLVAVGWVGTIAYFFLIGAVWLHLFRMRRDSRAAELVRFACICLMTVFTLAMLTENISRGSMNTFSPLLWAVIGISYAVQRQPAPEGSRERFAGRRPPSPWTRQWR